jgi:hypothetical protein
MITYTQWYSKNHVPFFLTGLLSLWTHLRQVLLIYLPNLIINYYTAWKFIPKVINIRPAKILPYRNFMKITKKKGTLEIVWTKNRPRDSWSSHFMITHWNQKSRNVRTCIALLSMYFIFFENFMKWGLNGGDFIWCRFWVF